MINRYLKTFCLQMAVAFATFAIAIEAHAQPALEAIPARIAMCEDTDGCSNWSFQGTRGSGSWSNGAIAELTVEQFNASTVILRRVDAAGAAQGLTAVYTGTRNGFSIEGLVKWSWPGHIPDGQTNWHAILAPPLPPRLPDTVLNNPATHRNETAWLVCEDTATACSATQPPTRYLWTLGSRYGNVRNVADPSAAAGLTIDSLSPGMVVLRRTDLTGAFAGLTGLYTGTLHGNTMQGAATWIWPGKLQKPLTGNWVASASLRSCDKPGALSLAETKNIAGLAWMLADKPAAFRCTLQAAQGGDADAQTTVGSLYLQGDGTPKNYSEAMTWFGKAAEQNNLDAMNNLSYMFRKGLGGPVDTLRANYVADLSRVRRRQLKVGTRIMQPGLGALLPLVALFAGAPLEDTSDDPFLYFRVTHEGAVITHMVEGMSRVQAEDSTYKEEAKDRQMNQFHCQSQDFLFGRSSPGREQFESQEHFDTRKAGYEQDLRDNPACPTGDDEAIEAKNQQYLACVHRLVDSEKIEAGCHLF